MYIYIYIYIYIYKQMPTLNTWLEKYGQKKHTHNLFKSTNISLLFRSFKMNYVINYKLFVFFFVHIYILYIWVLAGLFQRRLEYSFIIGSSHRKVSFFFFFFFFYLGFLSRTFTNHRTAGEGGGHYSHYHFYPLPLPFVEGL